VRRWPWALLFATAIAIVAMAQVSLAQTAAAPVAVSTAQASPVPDAAAADPVVEWGASIPFVSAYVWRGFVVADAACFQPTASVAVRGLTITTWFNVIAGSDDAGWSEHDLIVDYTLPVGGWTVSAGYTNYYFPTITDGKVSNEFYGGVGWSGLLSPTVTIYQDVSVGAGTYLSAGVSQSFPVSKSGITIAPAATIGYNHHQWVAGTGWSDLNVGVTVTLPAGKHVDIAASFNYSKSLQPDWFPSRGYSGITFVVH